MSARRDVSAAARPGAGPVDLVMLVRTGFADSPAACVAFQRLLGVFRAGADDLGGAVELVCTAGVDRDLDLQIGGKRPDCGVRCWPLSR